MVSMYAYDLLTTLVTRSEQKKNGSKLPARDLKLKSAADFAIIEDGAVTVGVRVAKTDGNEVMAWRGFLGV